MSFHRVIQGDVLDSLRTLADGSVHCCVTSPPYWGLRDYGMPGQIGLEPTPEAYVARMVEVFREVRRVLRDDGVLFLNIGDSYSQSGMGGNPEESEHRKQATNVGSLIPGRKPPAGYKPKDLVGIPWLLAFALRNDGWYLRSDIIWSKPNPMPESVTDRPTKAHEYVFLLSKSARYWYDADAVKEAGGDGSDRWGGAKMELDTPKAFGGDANGQNRPMRTFVYDGTRNRRTVWTIATQPYPEAHFATYPEALVEPCIKAGTSERGCCPKCGQCWERPVSVASRPNAEGDGQKHNGTHYRYNPGGGVGTDRRERAIGDFRPACRCRLPNTIDAVPWSPVPCTVLDPFLGSGTTLAVAAKLGRSGIGIELNPAYVALAEKRIGLAKNPHTWRDASRADAASLFHQEPA